MNRKTFTLTEQTLGLILDTITTEPTDGTVQVSIHERKDSRSIEQNALYWGAWLPSLQEQTGYTVDELHERFKRTFMLRIYLAGAENEKQEQWVGLYDVIKEDGTELMIQRALQTISTTWATVDQFKQYLDTIEAFCIDKGYKLPASVEYEQV